MYKRIFVVILTFSFLLLPHPASAQGPDGPIYIVQSGDTLWDIASRFNVDLDELMLANDMEDGNLFVGQEIVIPGLAGVTGVLRTETVPYGDNLRSLMRRTQAPREILRRLNRLVSPTELYAGVSLIVPVDTEAAPMTGISLTSGGTLLEEAVRQNSDIWSLTALNQLENTSTALPGEILYIPAGDEAAESNANGLPPVFASATIANLPLVQGGTAEINVTVNDAVTLSGSLTLDKEYPLHFFPYDAENNFAALQGIQVTTEPGAYPLKLEATYPDGRIESYEQRVLIQFGVDNPYLQYVPSVDPEIFREEDEQVASITANITPTRYWQNQFLLPVGQPYCIKEWFGTPRSYSFNGSDYNYYHGGIDYGVCSQEHPLDIYAAATGKVVFTGELPVRGNTTIVDNGWGVYTLYAHQNQIYVSVDEQVEAGQTIGEIGATGHVTGPHLHWEMWVDGVQVNPLTWLEQTFP